MSSYSRFKRPTPVLKSLPRSANVIYDILATSVNEDGCCRMSLLDLCAVSHLCRRTVQRGIKRLSATHLIDLTRGTGRGHRSEYRVRAFLTGSKRRKQPVAKVAYCRFLSSFSQQRVTFPPHPPIEETKKILKTRHVLSRGQIMQAVRRVTNEFVYPEHRLPIQNTVGRIIFKEGRYDEISSRPGILRDLLNLLTSEPSGCPPPGAPQKRVYAWIRAEIERIVRRHVSGLAEVMDKLLEHIDFSTENGDNGPKGPQRQSLLTRGVPTWGH